MEESMFCDENGKPFPRTNKFDMELYNKELEKENKALGERVLQLQADKGKLIDENRKMRCCENCKNVRYEWGEKVIEGVCRECKKYNKWELAE